MDFVYQGRKNKNEAFAELLEEQKLLAEECLYVGDDVVDIPVMRKVGIGCAVADAVEEVIEIADYIASKKGGHGAVREILVWILKEQNLWEKQMKRYLED